MFDAWWLAWTGIAIIEALQALIVFVCAYRNVPIVIKNPLTGLPAPVVKGLEPEREIFFYAVFLIAALVILLAGFWFYRRRARASLQALGAFLTVETAWVALQLFAAFKWITYRYPFYSIAPFENSHWVAPFFLSVFVLAILSKLSWWWVYPWVCRHADFFTTARWPRGMRAGITAVFFAVLAAVIYAPNPDLAMHWAIRVDQGQHWQAFFHNRVDFPTGFRILMAAAFVYSIALFYLIYFWTNSHWLAALGVLLAVKMNMFHPGVMPCVWIFPQQSLAARWLDVFWLMALWHFIKGKDYRDAVLVFVLGMAVWSVGIIKDVNGLSPLAFYNCLHVRQFFPFVLGFIIPMGYLITLLVEWWRWCLGRRCARGFFAAAIAIYGLLIYSVYVRHPFFYTYGAVIVPWVLVCCFWLARFLAVIPARWRRLAGFVFAAVGLLALLTSRWIGTCYLG